MIKKALAIFLSFLFILSTANLTLASHYCRGKLVKTQLSFTNEKASCGMETTPSSCENHVTFKKDCCRDNITHISIEDSFTPQQSLILHKIQLLFPILVSVTGFDYFSDQPQQIQYPPDIPIEHQAFSFPF